MYKLKTFTESDKAVLFRVLYLRQYTHEHRSTLGQLGQGRKGGVITRALGAASRRVGGEGGAAVRGAYQEVGGTGGGGG